MLDLKGIDCIAAHAAWDLHHTVCGGEGSVAARLRNTVGDLWSSPRSMWTASRRLKAATAPITPPIRIHRYWSSVGDGHRSVRTASKLQPVRWERVVGLERARCVLQRDSENDLRLILSWSRFGLRDRARALSGYRHRCQSFAVPCWHARYGACVETVAPVVAILAGIASLVSTWQMTLPERRSAHLQLLVERQDASEFDAQQEAANGRSPVADT